MFLYNVSLKKLFVCIYMTGKVNGVKLPELHIFVNQKQVDKVLGYGSSIVPIDILLVRPFCIEILQSLHHCSANILRKYSSN